MRRITLTGLLLAVVAILNTLHVQSAAAQGDIEAIREQFEGLTKEEAEELGFTPHDPFCIDSSVMGQPGLGAMGFHYVKEDVYHDNEVNADQPEVLLLNGEGRVVGVEWETTDTSVEKPSLFGQEFVFSPPHPGRESDHYMLHVYFQSGGEELFETWNPDLTCPEGSLPPAPAGGVPAALPETGANRAGSQMNVALYAGLALLTLAGIAMLVRHSRAPQVTDKRS